MEIINEIEQEIENKLLTEQINCDPVSTSKHTKEKLNHKTKSLSTLSTMSANRKPLYKQNPIKGVLNAVGLRKRSRSNCVLEKTEPFYDNKLMSTSKMHDTNCNDNNSSDQINVNDDENDDQDPMMFTAVLASTNFPPDPVFDEMQNVALKNFFQPNDVVTNLNSTYDMTKKSTGYDYNQTDAITTKDPSKNLARDRRRNVLIRKQLKIPNLPQTDLFESLENNNPPEGEGNALFLDTSHEFVVGMSVIDTSNSFMNPFFFHRDTIAHEVNPFNIQPSSGVVTNPGYIASLNLNGNEAVTDQLAEQNLIIAKLANANAFRIQEHCLGLHRVEMKLSNIDTRIAELKDELNSHQSRDSDALMNLIRQLSNGTLNTLFSVDPMTFHDPPFLFINPVDNHVVSSGLSLESVTVSQDPNPLYPATATVKFASKLSDKLPNLIISRVSSTSDPTSSGAKVLSAKHGDRWLVVENWSHTNVEKATLTDVLCISNVDHPIVPIGMK